jgi:prepilin-type N-terminal cleavage/methylation domain-containing protein
MNGFSLLEVMLALLILSIGLSGIAGMHISSIRYAEEAYHQSLATTRLSSMLDRLRTNRSTFSRERELLRWNELNKQIMPEGEGSYICEQDHCSVTINWKHGSMQTLTITAKI